MTLQIKKAERTARKLRMAITGPAGSGKTYTALTIASGVSENPRVLVIDSEQNSSTMYASEFSFDVLNLPNTNYKTYIEAFRLAANNYDVVICDSLSHAWESFLEEAENITQHSSSKNSFQAWGKVTPIFKAMMQEILRSPYHFIATMRVKTDYVVEEFTDGNGKKRTRPVKIGLAPIFRTGNEYEFDVIANMDLDNCMTIEKTRMSFLAGKPPMLKPSRDLGKAIFEWLASGKAEEVITADANPQDYKLECAGSKFSGRTLAEIQAENPQWMLTVLADATKRAALTSRDIANVTEFCKEKK